MATRPIEPGCLVLAISGDYAGRCGTAVEFLPKGRDVFFVLQNDLMELPFDCWSVDLPEVEKIVFPASALRRIDGFDQQEDLQDERDFLRNHVRDLLTSHGRMDCRDRNQHYDAGLAPTADRTLRLRLDHPARRDLRSCRLDV